MCRVMCKGLLLIGSPGRVVVTDGSSVAEGLEDGIALQHPIHDRALLELHPLLAIPDRGEIPYTRHEQTNTEKQHRQKPRTKNIKNIYMVGQL